MMERRERNGEGEEKVWVKLRRVGKRGGNSTPAASFWRTNDLYQGAPLGLISSRKLAAAFWELHHYKLPLDNLRRGVTVPPPRRRRGQPPYDNDMDGPEAFHPPPTSDMPESSSNSRRHVAESLMNHHPSIEKSIHATQTLSSSSCGSSVELASSKHATPSSSFVYKGRNSESAYSLKASTGLLKFFSHIWSLEEKNVSNKSLIKKLKRELSHAQFNAKELERELQGDRLKMDELMKHTTGGELLRKNEQDRINAAILSTRDELEIERKLRKRSESLETKLARELCEVKTCLTSISKELEEERMSRGLLEDLCDELASGIIDCEKELHDLRQKSGKEFSEGADRDQLILRISQAWLDERMQVKQEHDAAEKDRNIDKFSSEIEGFLQSGRNSTTKIHGCQMQRNPMFQKSYLQSIPLNVSVSAARDDDHDDRDDDDDGSSGSQSDCFHVDKTSEFGKRLQGKEFQENFHEEMLKQKELKEKLEYSNRTRALNPPLLQAKFEEHIAQAISCCASRNQVENVERKAVGQGNQGEIGISPKTEFFQASRNYIYEHKHESEGISEPDSNYANKKFIRYHHSFSESDMQPGKDHTVTPPLWRNSQSPVREWAENLPLHDPDISETPLRFLPESERSTSVAKLLKAGTGGEKSRSRQRSSIFPSRYK